MDFRRLSEEIDGEERDILRVGFHSSEQVLWHDACIGAEAAERPPLRAFEESRRIYFPADVTERDVLGFIESGRREWNRRLALRRDLEVERMFTEENFRVTATTEDGEPLL
jgi:hypothetical protein